MTKFQSQMNSFFKTFYLNFEALWHFTTIKEVAILHYLHLTSIVESDILKVQALSD